MEGFVAWWAAHILLPDWLSVFFVSMIPLVEERGGLILARMLNMPLWSGVFWCVVGNIVPIPFILLGIKKFLHWLSDHHFSKLAEWVENKAEKNRPKIEKYGFWGLAIFVGIPLPGTGAWTGSLVAAVFDMDLKKASLSILIGIFIAAVIMTIVSYGFMGALIS
jgi:Predicted membrane protein